MVYTFLGFSSDGKVNLFLQSKREIKKKNIKTHSPAVSVIQYLRCIIIKRNISKYYKK